MLLDRRKVARSLFCLCGSGGMGLGTACLASTSQGSPDAGCTLFENSANNQAPPVALTNVRGIEFNQDFENGLVSVFRELETLFEVDVSFGYYDDDAEYHNACARSVPVLNKVGGQAPKDGSVVIGRNLLKYIRGVSINTGAALTAVAAHEIGHIVQYKFLTEELTALAKADCSVVRAELHADFMSGYYAAFRKQEQPDYPAAIQAITQFREGNDEYTESFHGTREDRGSAVHAGFKIGHSGPSLPPKDVAMRGLDYVSSLDVHRPPTCKSGS